MAPAARESRRAASGPIAARPEKVAMAKPHAAQKAPNRTGRLLLIKRMPISAKQATSQVTAKARTKIES